MQTLPFELYVLPSQLVPASQPLAPDAALDELELLAMLGSLALLGSLGSLGSLGELAALFADAADPPSEACAIDIVVNAGTA
ncbi:hypothetical protein [Yoonia sp.]|uniref:hypothetical protein n=1 Tax=Yoonia sp. TaxID=2212373 RepID=UPI00397669C9